MTRFTPRVEHLDGDVFDTIQAFCRLVVPKASPHDGRNAMRGEKTGCPNIQFRAQGGRRMSIFSRISSRISYSDFTSWYNSSAFGIPTSPPFGIGAWGAPAGPTGRAGGGRHVCGGWVII